MIEDKVLLGDIESYPNFFMLGVKGFMSKETVTFEISEERNDLKQLCTFLTSYSGVWITFNGIGYDNIVLMYIRDNYKLLSKMSVEESSYAIKQISNKAINSDDNFDDIKWYKWAKKRWTDIDLLMYWSKMLRKGKQLSLKALGIQLGYPVIQELPYHHNSYLSTDELPVLRNYNTQHDLGILEMLTNKMMEDIGQRKAAINAFGFGKECYSWDGVKLGLKILIKEYCNEYGVNEDDIWELRTPFPLEGIKLSDVIFDKISFKPTVEKIITTIEEKKEVKNCNSFYTLFEDLKRTTVFSTKDLSYTVMVDGLRYDVKSGGLHSKHENEKIYPDLKRFLYRDADVEGYYPSVGAEYNCVPAHLPGMDKVLAKVKRLKTEYKKAGRIKDANLYKLAMNGGYYGNLNNEHTPMFDPLQMLKVTINGQLFLLMLCEKLLENGIQIDSCNTDGVTAIIPIEKEEKYKEICAWWEDFIKMTLEYDDFEFSIRKNVNNYLVKKVSGKLKKKGIFKHETKEIPLGDSVDSLVTARCLEEYFINGIRPEEVINNPDKYGLHIYDFCLSNKISKQYTVYWNGEKQQQLNRYYFSKNSPYLYKKKQGKNMENVNVGLGVQLFNTYEEKPWNEYKINTAYYSRSAWNIIDELNNKNQLVLF